MSTSEHCAASSIITQEKWGMALKRSQSNTSTSSFLSAQFFTRSSLLFKKIRHLMLTTSRQGRANDVRVEKNVFIHFVVKSTFLPRNLACLGERKIQNRALFFSALTLKPLQS